MFLSKFFNFKKSCIHSRVSPNLESGYCPDCGKLIKNEWYITRCSCCGVKLKTIVKNNEVMPEFNYCTNCGCNEYKVEKLDKINFIDINFAVLIKKVETELLKVNTTQCWQEKNDEQPRLLVQYL